MQSIKCIAKVFDNDLDTWWALFEWEDDKGKIRFRMPINEGDFEMGKKYRCLFREYDYG